jgi:hypothetical protein
MGLRICAAWSPAKDNKTRHSSGLLEPYETEGQGRAVGNHGETGTEVLQLATG